MSLALKEQWNGAHGVRIVCQCFLRLLVAVAHRKLQQHKP